MGTVTSLLQIGQTLRMRTSQSSISVEWKMWPQGSTLTRSPSTKLSRQMAHSSQLQQFVEERVRPHRRIGQ